MVACTSSESLFMPDRHPTPEDRDGAPASLGWRSVFSFMRAVQEFMSVRQGEDP